MGAAGSGSRLLPPCLPQAEVPPSAGLGALDPQEGVRLSLQSAPVRQSQSTGPGGWTRQSGERRRLWGAQAAAEAPPPRRAGPGAGQGAETPARREAKPGGRNPRVPPQLRVGTAGPGRSGGKACKPRGAEETGRLMWRGWAHGGEGMADTEKM